MVLGTAQLVGCAPEPAPAPSPTPAFASEDEAFAAAEEVYRAYNDAGNARRAESRDADPQRYLTGVALESDLDAERYFEEHHLHILGEAMIDGFRGESANLSDSPIEVVARVCINVKNTRVVDDKGDDVTPADRPARLPLEVTFVGSKDTLLIADSVLIEGEEC
ncbi:hypothetical protein ACTJKH_02565 [Microbacterium sp. 22215]|uniref:hypothetical protein n=1 Tax=Microbacterium sp. 22215 TaxID=3453893 RepID=UPI003F82511E